MRNYLAWIMSALVLVACEPADDPADDDGVRINFEVAATVDARGVDEISGMELLAGSTVIVHNDDGEPELFVVDGNGELVVTLRVDGAVHRDWEDLTWVPHAGGRWLAIGDIGDNLGLRSSIQIYFADIPTGLVASDGSDPDQQAPLEHTLELTYPDGPRDCESLAYDAASGMILLLTKRDKPPRLYGVDAAAALSEPSLTLEFLGEAPRFRPPTRDDLWRMGKDGAWVAQPTGMDINSDGSLAAVITYRSLFLFRREPDQSWAEAFRETPREFLGPVSRDEEAIAFSDGMDALFITTEGRPAPIYRVELPPPN